MIITPELIARAIKKMNSHHKSQMQALGRNPEKYQSEYSLIRDLITGLMAAREEVYLERNRLVAFLARLYPSGIAKTDISGWDPEWHNCVYIDTPEGQMSWHYHDTDAWLFEALPPYKGEWDCHTTGEKYKRLWKLTLQKRVKEIVLNGK